ncbi:GTP pyrophosphokinase [Ornithinimicrobium cryptoxanthini]|uniref:GTP pyrophosphokinase n=1 Tax=Ornithinimicrobium cryptoxanthini TaxID=2934161 RepID=UPI002473FDE9|nr:GTP pyrophosphokinase [Ornithinimicrobium cryptoxanthini]
MTQTPREIDRVREAVQEYLARQPELVRATDRFVALLTSILDDAGINYLTVTGRTKSVESFAGKAARMADGELLYTDPGEQITDQIGLRVITYVRDDVDAVVELLAQELTVLADRDMGRETAEEGRWGYSSRHLVVAVDASRTLTPEREALRTVTVSVQVRSVLQHAWAEFEHDIRYKGTVPEEHAPDLNRRFTLAAGLLELADHEFSAIRDRLQATMPEQHAQAPDEADPRLSAQELAKFLAGQYPDAGWSRTEHYSWISGLLLELGITSLDELRNALAAVDAEVINDRMGYRYPPAAVRRLDDALLSVFGEDYVTLHGNAHRVDQLHERLAKLD